MKIAQVCPRYSPCIGGVETHVKEISERLVKKGFEVDVLTTDTSGEMPKEEIINYVKVKRFKSWTPDKAYYFSRKLKRYLAENSEDYNILHAHDYHSIPALYAAKAKGRNRLVFTPHYHGKGHTFFRSLLHIPWGFVASKIFERADKVICVSNYEKSLVANNFKVDEKKISVIPNGVSLDEFNGLACADKKEKDCKIILYVGSLKKHKGVDCIVRCLPQIGSNFHLEIVGEGPYKKRLVNLVSKLGVEDTVRFYHNLSRNELLLKYAHADLFVSLSKYEAFGITVAEALASGTPCIVIRDCALEEFVDDRNCFGINYPIDFDELVVMIKDVIGRATEKVDLWDWNDVAKEIITVYEQLA